MVYDGNNYASHHSPLFYICFVAAMITATALMLGLFLLMVGRASAVTRAVASATDSPTGSPTDEAVDAAAGAAAPVATAAPVPAAPPAGAPVPAA